jgi:hypothetical protein
MTGRYFVYIVYPTDKGYSLSGFQHYTYTHHDLQNPEWVALHVRFMLGKRHMEGYLSLACFHLQAGLRSVGFNCGIRIAFSGFVLGSASMLAQDVKKQYRTGKSRQSLPRAHSPGTLTTIAALAKKSRWNSKTVSRILIHHHAKG